MRELPHNNWLCREIRERKPDAVFLSHERYALLPEQFRAHFKPPFFLMGVPVKLIEVLRP